MTFRERNVFLGVTVSLALAVTLVVAWWSFGTRTTAIEPLHDDAVAEAAWARVEEAVLARPAAQSKERAVLPASTSADVDASISPLRRRDAKRREADFAAEFSAISSEKGAAEFERVAREVLASDREPLSRRVAALRALAAANVDGTDASLAWFVQNAADVSDGQSPSLPRAALRALFERAPANEETKRTLARLAFSPDVHVTEDLRRVASASLAASMPGAKRDDVRRLLDTVADPADRDAAIQALQRDTNFDAKSATAK